MPKRRELRIVGNTADKGVGLQSFQPTFDMIEHFSSSSWILRSQIRHQTYEILLGNREQTDGLFI
jgi:hypothetical protein